MKASLISLTVRPDEPASLDIGPGETLHIRTVSYVGWAKGMRSSTVTINSGGLGREENITVLVAGITERMEVNTVVLGECTVAFKVDGENTVSIEGAVRRKDL